MKHTTTKMKFFLYICLGLVFLNSCTLEEDIIKKNDCQEKIKLESKKFSELLKLPVFSNAYKRLINKKVILSNESAARTALEDQYGFTIVESKPVKVITDQGSTSYVILIERGVKENLKFENLVINVKDSSMVATVLKYSLSQKAIYFEEHDSYIMDITQIDSELLELVGKQVEGGQICFEHNILMCNVGGGGYNDNHVADANCIAYGLGLYLGTYEVCYSSGGGGGSEGGWIPNTNYGPGPHGGNGTNSVSVSPIVADEDVLANATSPCELLKKLEADNSFKNRMSGLIYNARNWGFEKLWVLNNYSVPTAVNNYSYVGFQGSVSSPTAAYASDTNMQGLIHSHFVGLLSIFSAYDLQDLYFKMRNNLITDNYFTGVVTSDSAYILQVPDRSAFIAFGDKYLSSDDKLDAFMKDIMGLRYGISPNKGKDENELNFLKMMKNLNTGLLLASADFTSTTVASPDIFNSWVKKEYSNINNQVVTTQCK